MSQAAQLKVFAGDFGNQRLFRLADGSKGATLGRSDVVFPPSSLKVVDLLLLRLEYGDKRMNDICKQVLRLDSAVAGTSTYQGPKGTSNLASKLNRPLKKLDYFIRNYNRIAGASSKCAWLRWVLQRPWNSQISNNEWGLKQEGLPATGPGD